MADLITCMIGGEKITLPPIMNFAQLERCWPSIKAISTATDAVAMTSAAIALISGALLETRPDFTVPRIKSLVRVNKIDGTDERPGILSAADNLCLASGLVTAGETEPSGQPTTPAA